MKTLNELAEEFRQEFKDAKVSDVKMFPCYGEDKWDGEFVTIFISRNGIKIANRHDSIYNPTSYILPYLPKVECVIIGEYISLKGDLYHYLSDRVITDCPTLALRIHSIVYLGNKDCRDLDYETRWRMLEQLFPIQSKYVQLVNHRFLNNQTQVEMFYTLCKSQGREGIVIKPLGSLKEDGLKIKPKITIDCAIIGMKKSKKWLERGIPNSFVLGVLDNGVWKRFGESSSGLTDTEREKIGKTIIATKIGEDKHFIYCKPSIVLEIMCQEIKPNGFRHPRIIRVRYDKNPSMVTPFDQIKRLIKL